MKKEAENHLENLDQDSLNLTKSMDELLVGEKVLWCRYDSIRNEITIRFESGRTLFIDDVKNAHDISIT